MEIISLTAGDVRLLAMRFDDHANSYMRMVAALEEDGAAEALARCRALRQVERAFGVDLGSLCHRFLHRDDASTHPIERAVMNYIAQWHGGADSPCGFWIRTDRIREVRGLMGMGEAGEQGGMQGFELEGDDGLREAADA